MTDFRPDFTNIIEAAFNRKPARLPLYDHAISGKMFDRLLKREVSGLANGDYRDKVEYFKQACACLVKLGYDIYPLEHGVCDYIQGGQGLIGKAGAIIQNRKDLESFPWEATVEKYMAGCDVWFSAMAEALPSGMKAVGGVGNGVFEVAQDFVPYTELVYLKADDPETYAGLFSRVGRLMENIWSRFLEKYSGTFCLMRMGDDLGFKTGPLLDPADVREHVIPQYAKVVSLAHKHKKPFLLHTCGKIFEVMDDIISVAKIDAKHSNEDAIAPFSLWCDRYGSKIGLFGGVDMNVICLEKEERIKKYVKEVIASAKNAKGLAIGCGNSIPEYVPLSGWVAMCEAVCEFRGDR